MGTNDNNYHLDKKIESLANKIEATTRLFSSTQDYEWENIFALTKEIQEEFKGVRYPTKQERETAWQLFCELRNKAYDTRKMQKFDTSNDHYKYFKSELNSLFYHATSDKIWDIISFGTMKTTKDEIIRKGSELKNLRSEFREKKDEMINEHKSEIHTLLIEVRESHDLFWGDYKSYQAEKTALREQKQKDWEDRMERKNAVKEKIETHLESTKEKLSDAEEHLEKLESRRDDLQDKIDDSESDRWKEKAEGWLEELEEKISSKEEWIQKLKQWIEEDEEKLANWN